MTIMAKPEPAKTPNGQTAAVVGAKPAAEVKPEDKDAIIAALQQEVRVLCEMLLEAGRKRILDDFQARVGAMRAQAAVQPKAKAVVEAKPE